MRRNRIYLMPDHTSSSLWCWDPDGDWSDAMVALDELPLTTETKKALEAWSAHLWLAVERPPTGDGRPFDQETFEVSMEAEGERLLNVVRAELGDEYEVGYARFDPVDARGLDHTKRIEWPSDTP